MNVEYSSSLLLSRIILSNLYGPLYRTVLFSAGVTSHGLSCEICKFKAHKKCASKAQNNCKWTTLASMGKEIIEESDGVRAMTL